MFTFQVIIIFDVLKGWDESMNNSNIEIFVTKRNKNNMFPTSNSFCNIIHATKVSYWADKSKHKNFQTF